MKKTIILLSALLVSVSTWAKDTLNIYAASSMTNVVNDLISVYESEHDIDIVPIFGGSSSLARQIEKGAPADVFLSANEQWVQYLIDSHYVKASNVTLLAGNQLVLIKPINSKLKPFNLKNKMEWLQVLNNSRMAVSNTNAVPVGMYSKEALVNLGVWNTVQSKLAQTNNVRLALTLVEREEATLGMVYKTDAMLTNKVEVLSTVPPTLYSTIHYPLVQISETKITSAFVGFLQSEKARKVMGRYGFRTDMGTEKFAGESLR